MTGNKSPLVEEKIPVISLLLPDQNNKKNL